MRKLTKTAVVVASMAVMAMGATVMAGAATEGWVQSGSNWYYYVDGEKVSDQWVLAGDNWYFVDEEGRMVKNTFVRIDKYDGSSEVLDDNDIHASLGVDDIDDDSEFYYMNADGTMHTGWKEFKASNIYASPNSDKASTVWYYFGASGRMYVNEWLESNGEWYALSNNGQMYAEAVINNDLIDWDDDNYYYMKKDGAWVKGWYKTTKSIAGSAPDVAIADGKEGDKTANVFINDKDNWVYADPETGVLAQKEWVDINGKYYFFGIEADTDAKKDDNLLIETVLKSNGDELSSGNINYNRGFVVSGSAFYVSSDYYTSSYVHFDDDYNKADTAKKEAAMYSDVFVRWTNHDNKKEYFYLDKDGDALTTWKQLDDDYWIYGNSKGELCYDEVALINGKYYYFNQGGICDGKYLNNTVDYIAVVEPELGGDDSKKLDGEYHLETANGYLMYETSSDKNVYEQGVVDGKRITINSMRVDLADKDKDNNPIYTTRYKIDGRSVTVKSMTDNEVILAYTAKNYKNNSTDGSESNAYGKDITVYKLRTSAKLTGKVVKENTEE